MSKGAGEKGEGGGGEAKFVSASVGFFSNPGSAKPIIGASDRRQFAYVEKALSCLEIVREINSELWTNCAVEGAKS